MDEQERAGLVKKYRRSVKELEKTLEKIPSKAWGYKPEPEEWSINEIIVHLLDTELVSFNRARKLVAQPGSTVMGMDQNAYAANLNYSQVDIKAALKLLKALVGLMTDWLKTLPLEAYQISGTHPDYEGAYTLEQWLGHFSDHTYVHIEQIKNNAAAWKKSR